MSVDIPDNFNLNNMVFSYQGNTFVMKPGRYPRVEFLYENDENNKEEDDPIDLMPWMLIFGINPLEMPNEIMVDALLNSKKEEE